MNYFRVIVPCALAVLLSACQPQGTTPASTTPSGSASAPATPAASVSTDNSAPAAVVNGTPISRDFFEFYAKGFAGKNSITELTTEQKQQALDTLIRAQVVAQEATKEGLDKDPSTAALLQLARLNVLQQAVSERYLKD